MAIDMATLWEFTINVKSINKQRPYSVLSLMSIRGAELKFQEIFILLKQVSLKRHIIWTLSSCRKIVCNEMRMKKSLLCFGSKIPFGSKPPQLPREKKDIEEILSQIKREQEEELQRESLKNHRRAMQTKLNQNRQNMSQNRPNMNQKNQVARVKPASGTNAPSPVPERVQVRKPPPVSGFLEVKVRVVIFVCHKVAGIIMVFFSFPGIYYFEDPVMYRISGWENFQQICTPAFLSAVGRWTCGQTPWKFHWVILNFTVAFIRQSVGRVILAIYWHARNEQLFRETGQTNQTTLNTLRIKDMLSRSVSA